MRCAVMVIVIVILSVRPSVTPVIGNSFRLVPLMMTLNDICRSFHFTLQNRVSRKLYTIRPQKLKLLIRNQTSAFRWYACRWPWRHFEVIKLFHIKFLVNSTLYGKSYYRVLIGNHTLALDSCYFWWPWSTFEGNLSLGCHFYVHFSNLW